MLVEIFIPIRFPEAQRTFSLSGTVVIPTSQSLFHIMPQLQSKGLFEIHNLVSFDACSITHGKDFYLLLEISIELPFPTSNFATSFEMLVTFLELIFRCVMLTM